MVKKGDTLPAVARAFAEHGVTVTIADIQAANPGLDPRRIKVGQKIFIPASSE